MVFAIALGAPLGLVAALRRGRAVDWLARFLAVIGQATPSFWLGLMLIFFFAVQLGWFPTGGVEDGFRSLILPGLSLGLLELVAIMRLTRSGMIDVLETDFVRTARAKGLSERVVIRRHALRHALLPVVTMLGLSLGRLIGGSVIIEIVFAWPGIGRLIVDSIIQSDYPMVQASIIVLAASITVANLLVDVSYRLIDPRIRAGPPDGPADGGDRGAGSGCCRRAATGRQALAAPAGAVRPRPDRAGAARGGRGGGLAGDARPGVPQPGRAPAAARLRRGQLGPCPGHGPRGAGHLQPAAARGAHLSDRGGHRRAGRGAGGDADRAGRGLGGRPHRPAADAAGGRAAGAAGDALRGAAGELGGAEPAQRDHHPADLDLARVRPAGAGRRALAAGARLRDGLPGRWARGRPGSCAGTCSPMC